ncbi:MAG: hypothetical protein O2913_09355 [Chloroflexi bacterium]|nr:hypothetical protein [Chloroflexota bacterium]
MAELLGLTCSHGPIILTPPEVWHKGSERIFNRAESQNMASWPNKLVEERCITA